MTTKQAPTINRIGDEYFVAYLDGRFYKVSRTHPHYDAIIAAISLKDFDRLEGMLTEQERKLEAFVSDTGDLTVKGGVVLYKGKVIDHVWVALIKKFIDNGADPMAYVNCLDKIYQNPEYFARRELAQWAERANLAIAPDGDMYAFKIVRSTYFDQFSNTFDNSPGKFVEMDRAEVDPDRRNTCSYGLHACSREYLPQYSGFGSIGQGTKVILVKFNPKDVVAIPEDYNFAKMRLCCYWSIMDITDEVLIKGNDKFLQDQATYVAPNMLSASENTPNEPTAPASEGKTELVPDGCEEKGPVSIPTAGLVPDSEYEFGEPEADTVIPVGASNGVRGLSGQFLSGPAAIEYLNRQSALFAEFVDVAGLSGTDVEAPTLESFLQDDFGMTQDMLEVVLRKLANKYGVDFDAIPRRTIRKVLSADDVQVVAVIRWIMSNLTGIPREENHNIRGIGGRFVPADRLNEYQQKQAEVTEAISAMLKVPVTPDYMLVKNGADVATLVTKLCDKYGKDQTEITSGQLAKILSGKDLSVETLVKWVLGYVLNLG